MKKGQLVRGSKTLGLFVIGTVLLAQVFGGAISIASAQSEVTQPDNTQVVEPSPAPAPEAVSQDALTPDVLEEAPQPIVEQTPEPAPVPEAPPALDTPTDVPSEVVEPTPTEEPAPISPDVPPTTTDDSTTIENGTSQTQDPSTTEETIVPAEDTQVAAVSLPELSTEKDDYHPGETATIFGRFFGAFQQVFLKIFGDDGNGGNYTESTQEVTADENGSFVTTYVLENIYRPLYTVVASALSGEEITRVTFTDSTSGPNNAGAGANVNGPGTGGSWTNTGNILADDTNYATVTIGTNGTSEYLQATNYGFSIPAGAVINGIQVTLARQSSSNTGGASTNDADLNLLKGGVIVGTDKAVTTDWPTTMTPTTYGGVADLWGTTWTPADINASNFGVSLSVLNQSGFSNRTASVDYIQITVTYTLLQPDLTITKSNTVGGVAGLGGSFNWQLLVSNTGNASSTFAVGQTLMTDQLPTSGATYGSPTVGSTATTGTVNCSIVGTDLGCTAGTSVVIPPGGTVTVTIPVTPTNTGTLTNPFSGGVCSVDPNNVITTESSEGNNSCTSNSVTVSVLPDLIVTKTNDLGGENAVAGTPFTWSMAIANTGGATATFGPGFSVFRDSLPATTTASYGTPTVTFENGVTGVVNCTILPTNTLECTTGGSVVIPTDGIINISLPVTPLVFGSLINPRAGGVCVVDPTGVVTETNTTNNGCADSVSVADPVAPTVVSINRASTSPSNATNAVWSVVFSEGVTGVNAADFTLVNGGLTAPAIATVTGTGTTYTVTASTGGGTGTLGLNLIDDDSIRDSANNMLGGSGLGNGNFTGQEYTIDRVAPTVTVNQAVAQADPTNIGSVVFTVTFSEPVNGFATNDITIGGTAGGTKTATISTTSATTFDVTITWAPSTAGTVTASIAASRVTDAVGNSNTASTFTDNTVQYNLPTYNITSSASTGGTITPNGTTPVSLNANQAYSSVPSAGNILNQVIVDGIAQATRPQTFTFTGVTTTHSIIANFDSGWSAPTANPANNGAGTPTNAYSSNDGYATLTSSANTTDYGNFGLSIPPGATITGIQVAVEGNTSGRNPTVAISKNAGAAYTTARTITLTTGDATVITGSSTDLWSTTWTAADITNANFRLRVGATTGGGTASLDQVQVKVSYLADTVAPVLAEVTPVPTLTNDNTPNYTFSSTEAGTIVYGGDCSSVSTTASVGSNTKTFSTLSDGLHDNCTVSVVDLAGNTSTPLSVSAFTVDTQAPVITVLGNDPETIAFGGTYVDAGATATEGATVVTTGSVNTAIVGDYTLFYNATDTAANSAVEKTRLVHVVQASQTITFGALAGKTYGDADFIVSATSDSGLPVTFTTTGNCTNTGDSIHLTGAGSCTVTAHQAGDTNYTAAADVDQTFAIAQASSSVTIVCPAGVVYDGSAQTPCTATVTGFGGLNQSIPVIHTNNTDVGTANADATFLGDADYTGSSDAKTFAITPATSTTIVTCSASEVYTGSPITPCTVSVTGAGGLSPHSFGGLYR